MIKKHFTTTLFFTLLIFSQKIQAQVSVIPQPNEIKYTDGKFNYAKGFDIKITRGDDATKLIQKQLTDFVKSKNISIVPFSNLAVTLNLVQSKITDFSAEGYLLSITPAAVSITSFSNAGLFYGLQSFMQLLKADTTRNLPCVEIKDNPAFSYRGVHLDVVHHFFSADVIKQYLDAMAKLKLNQFQWQLADANTWRIELKNSPALTAKDNFYTQADVKDIIKYAQERFINIIPEIILPSATENASLQQNKNIIDEVSSLFPGKYINIGNSISDTETIHYLSTKNKKIIGLDNLLYPNETLISYKSNKNGVTAAKNGTDVIMAPRQNCSLDYYQDWDDEKKSFNMTLLTLDKAYSFNPVGKIKDSTTIQHILGGQAFVYSQFIKNTEELQYMVFPRLIALAECVWTKNANKKFTDFGKRLKAQKNYFYKEREEPKIDMVRIKPKK